MTKAARSGLLISIFLLVIAGATLALAQGPAPALFFSDLTSGPASGGENGNGVYVTLYGNNFGATQGSSTVSLNGSTSAVRVVSWGATWRWYQKTVVQVMPGATSGNFVVTVNGAPSNGLPFTVRSGRIFFISTGGSDSNNGSFAAPWQTIPKARSMAAGDVAYVMDGVAQTSDDGTGTRAAFQTGYSGGASGSAASPIALAVYPGATATIGGSPDYGIRVIADYWTIAGFKLAGNANKFQGDGVRVVANDATCNDPGAVIEGCLVAAQSSNVYFYGNYIHDIIHNTSKQGHALYGTTDTNHVWAGWNEVANNTTCYAVQFHSSPIGGSTGQDQFDLHVHDNVIHGDACAGLNFATVDPSKGVVEAYNNVIYHTGVGGTDGTTAACIYAPGYVNAGSSGSGTVDIYNNTLYDCGPSGGSPNGAVVAQGGSSPSIKYRLRNNLIYSAKSNEAYLGGDMGQFTCSGGNNNFFGNGGVPSTCGSGNLSVNPSIASISLLDFHLLAGSPLIDAGQLINNDTMDVAGVTRPQGSGMDIGAFEFPAGGTVQRPNPPTNLAVTVQ